MRLLCKLTAIMLTVATGLPAVPAGAEPRPQPQVIVEPPPMPGTRTAMSIEAPFLARAKGFDYDHQVHVALPASYAAFPNKSYPVLWVTDGEMMFLLAVGIVNLMTSDEHVPEMIVVSVGSPAERGNPGYVRRLTDFSPPGESYFGPGAVGTLQRKHVKFPDFPHKGNEFLSFLIDDLRPALAKKYRMSGDHALFGHSAGGLFAGYALFARPRAFSKYIISSPYLYGVDGAVFSLEERYAQAHDDLDVKVFLGAGDREISDSDYIATAGIVSATALLGERLRLRGYPSLKLTSRVYSGEDHRTVIPRTLMEAIGTLWRDHGAKAAQEGGK